MVSNFLTLAMTLCLVVPFASACSPSCRFSLCTESTVPLTPPNDTAVTSGLCLPNTTVGIANSGEALTGMGMGMVNISDLVIPGLGQAFSPSFFKLYTIVNTTFSGVGHEVPQSNQAAQLSGACIVLPVIDYQVLEETPQDGLVVVNNVALNGNPTVDCVSFNVA